MVLFAQNAACYTDVDTDLEMGAEGGESLAGNSGSLEGAGCVGMGYARHPALVRGQHEDIATVVGDGDVYCVGVEVRPSTSRLNGSEMCVHSLEGHHLRRCFVLQPDGSTCSDGHLSDIMPDVAMLTASFNQLQFQEQTELELDLGDGGSSLAMHVPPGRSPQGPAPAGGLCPTGGGGPGGGGPGGGPGPPHHMHPLQPQGGPQHGFRYDRFLMYPHHSRLPRYMLGLSNEENGL